MNDTQKNDELKSERTAEATDKRTLDEIEEEEQVSSDTSNSATPSPDEGAGRPKDDAASGPM